MVGHRRYTNNRIPGVNAIALTLHLARKWMLDVQLKYAVGSLASSIVENQGFSSIAGVDCGPPYTGILTANFTAVVLDQILVPVHFSSHG
jgi:hypothetical protein